MNESIASEERAPGFLAPLQVPLFRRIWVASVLSNLGYMFLSVGTGWEMTSLTADAGMVALVLTAMMLPMTLLSIPAGAIADMYDRRRIGLFSLALSMASAAALTVFTSLGLASPWLLLGFCTLTGAGMTLFNPAWQASVSEQVPRRVLGQAVALNSISFNIARSFGPALGGLVVAVAGASASFAATVICYVPLFTVMLFWRRPRVPSRLPPERIDRAVSAGIRYVLHSPPIRIVLVRTFCFGFGGSCLSALMPLVTRDLLHGGAQVFGVMLGAYGLGAVVGAIGLNRLRQTCTAEQVIALSTITLAGSIVVVATSTSAVLTAASLLVAGAGWMVALALCNVHVQSSAPRWVSGRLLAAYQTSVAGGVALGSWGWGRVVEALSVEYGLLFAALYLAVSLLLGRLLPLPSISNASLDPVKLSEPEVNLDLTGRSGPIVVQIEYDVPAEQARDFYRVMQALRSVRQRNGAYDWSIARDIGDAELWIERFQCPTWHDYLRQRDRNTPHEVEIQRSSRCYLKAGSDVRVRRLLERPFGSVRWTDDAPEDPLYTNGLNVASREP